MLMTKNKRLTVLHVATLSQPIRSDLGYGPIETIIHNIDNGLHSLGHRSIVACSGDSKVAGEHFVTIGQNTGPYWSDDTPKRRRAMNSHLSKVLARVKRGDIAIIHAHDAEAVKFIYDDASDMRVPVVMTLHIPPKESLLEEAYQRWCSPSSSPLVYCVPISEYQKKQYHGLVNTDKVVYHGIDVDAYPVKQASERGGYLFTIGRITPDKGQDKAVKVAKKTGSKLIIAGCVQNKVEDREFFASLSESIDTVVEVGGDPVDDGYFDKTIKPLLARDEQIIYIGEINSEHKKQWFQHARATLFPIQWGEPFGLVPVESMACGTPVIAFNKGAVPEIILDGKTGFIVNSLDEMIEAVGRIDSIGSAQCRQHVQDNFSIASMAESYSDLYRQIIDSRMTSPSGDLSPNTPPSLLPGSALVTT
jgi:glycosyltransferase involved in cell wall biosynthesis